MSRAARAVVVAGLAGQLSAALVGALPWLLLPASMGLYVVAAMLSLRASDGRGKILRYVGSALVLVSAGVILATLQRPLDPLLLKGSLGLLLVAAQVGQAMSWRQSRDLGSGLVTALGLLVLGASYAPDVLVGLPLLVGWVAVLVALSHLHGSQPVVPVTAVAVVLGLVAFLLVPVPVAAGVRSRLAPAPPREALGARIFSGDVLDLRLRGRLGTDTVASVPADAPVLWRSASFDHYDGASWARPQSTVLSGGPPYDVAPVVGPTREDRVTLLGSSDGTVWSPGRLTTVSAGAVRIPLVNEFGDVLLPGLRGGYTVTSDVEVTDPGRLRGRQGADITERRWREVPADLPDRVGALARQITAGATSRYDAAEAIAQWLRENATYRLDSPVPRRGEDAVDRFLFVDRTGFCEQFASAEAVLLRTLGIPARLVTGLAYGKPVGERRVFRVADLHAWVELWVPGVGWVSSDPTAGVPLAAGSASGSSLRQRLATSVSAGLTGLTRVPGGRTSLALGLLVLTAVAGQVLSRRPPARRTRKSVAGLSGGPALQAFLRLDARLGGRSRRPGESLRELSARLDPAVAAALGVVERECYAPSRPDPTEAVAVLDRYVPGP